MFYYFVRFLFTLYLKICYRLVIVGKENVPQNGPLIVCSNHINWLDPPVVGCVIKSRKIHFMAKEELFNVFFLGRCICMLGAFPVKRDTADRKAIKTALNHLLENRAIGLFPEGTRSKTGELQTPFNGVALIALKSGSPVLPVAIIGSYRFRQQLQVNIGTPFTVQFEEHGDKSERLTRISGKIMGEIEKLLKTG